MPVLFTKQINNFQYSGPDHGCALPATPTALKTRLNEALAGVESLEREKKNAVARGKRAKTTVKSLLGDLREKILINEELKDWLEFYSGHWKAPIAYYLTKSLSPATQRVLLSHALEELHARGIRVVCGTMDGHASNVSMCNQLGCELKGDPRQPLQTSFPHPVTGEKVFVMTDACHMLQLARDTLQAYSPIATTTGRISLYSRFCSRADSAKAVL
ncbi:uncharacterized protein LOC119020681 [Acanthopagrus latus]|uniref:uncharacterized protein LOC119020681 n=1 Tax=Acanthopagrus latus TaxID=8177 RepID=UPI00187BDC89|nr:uncharacterized protein LOC119020681 [Acanthopagrus latus]